jgi:hypothetical protein
MIKKRNGKAVYLASGGEEGFAWELTLKIYEKTKLFAGHFDISGELEKQRKQVRDIDRQFFKARLGSKCMVDKVLHHFWIGNSSEYTKVILLHKSEHPNGGIDVLRETLKKLWIEKEVWL